MQKCENGGMSDLVSSVLNKVIRAAGLKHVKRTKRK